MKTILHIIDTTGPGGAETVFIDLLSGLSAEQYRPVVVIQGKGWVHDELRRRGIEPIILNAKGSFNWRYFRQLVRLIKEYQVDLIQTHLLGAAVYGALVGLYTRVPVVATFHGSVDIGAKERLKWLKFTLINWAAKRVIAVSKNLLHDIKQRTRLSPNKMMVIYNGIDTQQFQRAKEYRLRAEYGWSESELIVGALGNIRPAKAYDVLLQAAALLKQESTPFRFVVAGQGKKGLYDELLRQREALGLEEHVKFLGFCEDPAEFLANLDIFLLSSTTEGFSIACIQALASQLPVLATRCGGPEEIIEEGEHGMLIEAGSAEAIQQGLQTLCADMRNAGRMSLAGKQHVIETFDISKMLDAYEEVYASLL